MFSRNSYKNGQGLILIVSLGKYTRNNFLFKKTEDYAIEHFSEDGGCPVRFQTERVWEAYLQQRQDEIVTTLCYFKQYCECNTAKMFDIVLKYVFYRDSPFMTCMIHKKYEEFQTLKIARKMVLKERDLIECVREDLQTEELVLLYLGIGGFCRRNHSFLRKDLQKFCEPLMLRLQVDHRQLFDAKIVKADCQCERGNCVICKNVWDEAQSEVLCIFREKYGIEI